MHKKGQAALEFLTTYGWAFLVILVMIGALAYFGVLNPSRFVPDTCTFSAAFLCDDHVINAGSVIVKLRNNIEAINITNITLRDLDSGVNYEVNEFGNAISSGCTADAAGRSAVCNAGAVFTLDIAGGDVVGDPTFAWPAGSKRKMSIDIGYFAVDSGVQFFRETGGDIVGTIQ